MIKDSMRSADLCSLTASNPDRIKDPIHRDKCVSYHESHDCAHTRKWKEESSLASDDDYAGSTPQRSL
jgi:hypothetical protein